MVSCLFLRRHKQLERSMLPKKASHYDLNYCIVMGKGRTQSIYLLGTLPDMPITGSWGSSCGGEKCPQARTQSIRLTGLDHLEIS